MDTEPTEHGRTEHKWFDYRAAQDYSGLSRTFLWDKIGTGELRAFKVGRKVRIEWEGQPQELLDILEETTSAILPERPDELTKRLLKFSETEGPFVVRRTRKRAEDSEKVVRWLKLTLREPSQP